MLDSHVTTKVDGILGVAVAQFGQEKSQKLNNNTRIIFAKDLWQFSPKWGPVGEQSDAMG